MDRVQQVGLRVTLTDQHPRGGNRDEKYERDRKPALRAELITRKEALFPVRGQYCASVGHAADRQAEHVADGEIPSNVDPYRKPKAARPEVNRGHQQMQERDIQDRGGRHTSGIGNV